MTKDKKTDKTEEVKEAKAEKVNKAKKEVLKVISNFKSDGKVYKNGDTYQGKYIAELKAQNLIK